jgi:nitrite reductase (NO-forming)
MDRNALKEGIAGSCALGLLAVALVLGSPARAEQEAVSIVQDPTAVGAPVGKREATTVKFSLEAREVLGVLDKEQGRTYMYWTFNGKVPGPLLRARIGDTIEITLKNKSDSAMIHNIDLHAVWGQGGGAALTNVAPGEEKSFVFKALHAGLFVYHCATPIIPQHISSGMYGMILIEPEGGLPKVDREFYLMQGDMYADEQRASLDVGGGNAGAVANNVFNLDKLLAEQPTYVVMNGSAGALAAAPMKAKVGETVRVFFGVGGPNLTSSFHVIGTIFDRVYNQASFTSPPLTDVQTTLVPPGGATMVEMKLRVPASYIFVDHALGRLMKGNVAILKAEGEAVPDIFRAGKLK